MPVASNTSPLLNLAIIDHLFLLPEQFGEVFIPPTVLMELKIDEDLPGSRVLRTAINDGWLITKAFQNIALVNLLRRDLHQGEAEAIALAIELSAERILLDEKEARQAARALGLSITEILGVLLRGWHDNKISTLKPLIERLQQDANFWISPELFAQVLQESGELEE